MWARYLALLLGVVCNGIGAQQDSTSRWATADEYGTYLTQHHRQMRQGQLVGCSIEYRVLMQDWAYQQGQPILVTWSLSLYANDSPGAVFGLKVVALNLRRREGRVVTVPNPPHSPI